MSRCLHPQTPPEDAFRGSNYLLTRYLEDFGRLRMGPAYHVRGSLCWSPVFHHPGYQNSKMQVASKIPTVSGLIPENGEKKGWVFLVSGLVGSGWVPPQSLTWNLKINPWKRRFLLETIIFRFHVKLWGAMIFCQTVLEWILGTVTVALLYKSLSEVAIFKRLDSSSAMELSFWSRIQVRKKNICWMFSC